VSVVYSLRQSISEVEQVQSRQSYISDFARSVQFHPPPLRPIIDSSNAWHQASASVVCTPLHGRVRFAIHSGVRLIEYVFARNCPFPFRDRHPNVTHFLGPSPLIIPNGISIGSAVFVWVPNAMLYNALSVGKKTPKTAFPLRFRHPVGGGRATAIGNVYKNSEDRACDSRDVVADRQTNRHTQTYSSQYFAPLPRAK